MASAIIHICVAKKINEKLNLNEKEFILGSIAPDLNKYVNDSRSKAHFLTTAKKDVPNINEFLEKYKDDLINPFSLGYFVHLYTDKIWFDEFISSLTYDNMIKLKDNTIIKTSKEQIGNLIYNDYSTLNIALLDELNLDLSLFYEPFQIPKTKITEISIEKLDILINQMGLLVMESKMKKSYVFDLTDILNFIDYASDKILNKIYDYKLKIHQY